MTDFNRTPEAQEAFKAKRKPKGPIKFNIQLNEEQKIAKSKILNNTITILTCYLVVKLRRLSLLDQL
jgi:hypothetical protein